MAVVSCQDDVGMGNVQENGFLKSSKKQSATP